MILELNKLNMMSCDTGQVLSLVSVCRNFGVTCKKKDTDTHTATHTPVKQQVRGHFGVALTGCGIRSMTEILRQTLARARLSNRFSSISCFFVEFQGNTRE